MGHAFSSRHAMPCEENRPYPLPSLVARFRDVFLA